MTEGVAWSKINCPGCGLPLRCVTKDNHTTARCANTNCPGDPAPTPDTAPEEILDKANS